MGTPFFILATGQSNIHGNGALNWSPNPRAKLWNNVRDNDASIGSAYAAFPNSLMGITARYAHNVAQADVNKDVYAAIYARGGRDIQHWIGGAFYTLDFGAFGPGKVYLNNANPAIANGMRVSRFDVFGAARRNTGADLFIGETFRIKQGSSLFVYRIDTWEQDAALDLTVYFTCLSSTGTLSTSQPVQIEFQPRFLVQIENSVPAALAAAGKSKVDILLWWQGESDADGNTRYASEFNFAMDYFASKPWWSPDTKVLICGINSTANNGVPYCDAMNATLAGLVNGHPERYFCNTAANLPANRWADVWHLTGQGFSDAGDLLFNSVYSPPLVDTGGAGSGVISSVTVGAMPIVMDISPNAAHETLSGGFAYGLWLDGAPHPYRDGSGNKYILLPHSENYRFLVPDWSNAAGWQLQGRTLEGARNTTEGAYNNRNWVFGVWSNGNTVYSLIHHEWYVDTMSMDGIGGYNAGTTTETFNRKWVNAISWASSNNGGLNFSTAAATNSSRLVLVPEPWNVQQKNPLYGFFHPSNIVKEGSYWYAAVEQRSLNAAGTANNGGVSLVRTLNVAAPTGWQFWDGSAWVTVDHNTYQGNLSVQKPHRFFAIDNHDYYNSGAYNSHMGQCLRYHTPTGQWVMFGFSGTSGSALGYSTSPTLANPQFTTIHATTVADPGAFNSAGGRYITVFDEAATDNNFINIGNTCTVLTTSNYVNIHKGTMTIAVGSAGTPTYFIAPSVVSTTEGSTVTYTVNTTNVPNGTVLYWTNAGTANGADFSDGANSGSFTITGNVGTFTRTINTDLATEGSETIIAQVRTGSTAGPIMATAATVTFGDSSAAAVMRIRNAANTGWIVATPSNTKIRNASNTGWVTPSAANFKLRNAANNGWLLPFGAGTDPTYSIGPLSTSMNEGASMSFNVSTTNFGSGTLYWTNAGTTSGADFVDGLSSGSVVITNNAGTITRALAADATLEGSETIILQLRTGSASGPIVATSAAVTVNDTSVPAPASYQLTMARNDLDFIYAPDVAHNGGTYIRLDFVISFDDFFTAGGNHLPFVINAKLTNPHTNHCGPIIRNGQNLWSYGRGFYILPGTNQIHAEHWNGTASPGIAPVTNVGGTGFNPATHTQVRVRIIGGLRTGPWADKMQISIRTMDGATTLFSGTVPWGWDQEATYKAAIAGIASGFVSPNSTGCVEKTGPGTHPNASATISEITHVML